jgi:hypothetical protein
LAASTNLCTGKSRKPIIGAAPARMLNGRANGTRHLRVSWIDVNAGRGKMLSYGYPAVRL